MSWPKLLLAVCSLQTIELAAGVPGSRHTDRTRLAIADRPARQEISPWERNANARVPSVPPYAVKMEPAARYSQQDPLYATATTATAASNNSYGSPAAAAESAARDRYDDGHLGASTAYGHYQPTDGGYYHHKEPEPIIEIIIKESNESLPAPPPPPQPPQVARPAREPVQVFYVKYKKNPNSYGDKEDIVYEPPVPAVTPSSAEVHSGGEGETAAPELSGPPPYGGAAAGYVTGPPPPSTTYRTIIKPDSEVYHGTGGLRVTFGKTEAGGGWSPSFQGADAQKRDSVGEASDARPEVRNKGADREFKRSFAQPAPQLVDYQKGNGDGNSNHFEASPHANRPPPPSDGFGPSNPSPQQLQIKPATQQIQNYFREDNLRPNFQGQIPILNQPFKPQQNGFEGIADQRPKDFIDHFRNQPTQQQFNHPPNFPQFHNPPNVQQLPHQQIHNSPNHQQFNNHHNHQQFINQQSNQQFNNPQNHQQFTNQQFNGQQRQPDFQLNPPLKNPTIFQDRPVQTNSNNDRPFINKPFENRPLQDRPFDNKPFESRPLPDRHFENRPFENVPAPNRPFESQPIHTKPFENRPVFDRPFENRPIQNRPGEIRPILQDRPFDNRQHQGILNYRPNKPPNPQNIPLNPNPSFIPNDRRPTNSPPPPPPPQLPSNYNTQPISTKHTVDLGFSPLQQQQQHQQFQQQQLQQQQLQQQFPSVNNYQTSSQQPSIKLQPSTLGVNTFPTSQYQQQSAKPQQFNPEIKPSSTPQLQITPSNGFKIEPSQQPAQSGQFVDFYNRYSPTQTEKNSIHTDNIPWQISSQSQNSFKQLPQEHKEYFSASTTKNTLDTTSKSVLKATEKPASSVTLQYKERKTPTSTVTPVKATTTELAKNETKKTDFKNIASLPDEVPDELREQLLSSGILSNADIQILDYDKVGDIPIESLPPEALENLYGQGSAPVPSIVLPPNKSNVQMKVVKYDPSTEEGRKIENAYVDRPKSQTLDPVVLNDKGYNRFLPLNINGTYFPIPDSPLLKNKAIGSVVILSPVGYDLSEDQSRPSRNTAVKVRGVHFIVGDVVKNLVKDPNRKNFETWLEKEKNTPSEEQSVVLLVTKPNSKANGKEIYMYDVTHNQVNKLSGDLSSTFVDVAESNSHSHDLDNLSSEEEVDVVVSENSANNDKPAVVSGYSKTNDFSSSIVATAN